MFRPLVSIIIPSFNREELIADTLESVLNQTYDKWECIVVDDGSTDETISIVEKFREKDRRYSLFKRNRKPKGANTCRNIGIDKSNGEFIIFLDSDDVLLNNCINNRISQFSVFLDCDFLVFPTLVLKDGHEYKTYNKPCEDYLKAFITHNIPWTIMGSIWKAEFIKLHKGFDENFPRLQDVELNIRILAHTRNFKFLTDHKADNIYRNTEFKIDKQSIEKILFSSLLLIDKMKRTIFDKNQLSSMNSVIFEFYINFLRRYALYYFFSDKIAEYVNYNFGFNSNSRSKKILYFQRLFYNTKFLKLYPVKILSFFLWRFFKIER